MGRPTKEQQLVRSLSRQAPNTTPPQEMILPNHSGVGHHIESNNTFLRLDCSNDPLTGDLTIAAQQPLLILQDTDTTTPFTSIADEHTIVRIGNNGETYGGLEMTGYTSGTSEVAAFLLRGFLGQTDPADDTPAVIIEGRKSNGAGTVQNLGADETILAVRNGGIGNDPVLLLKGGGDMIFNTSGSGLPYGSMYADDISETVTVSASGTWYEVNGGNMTTGQNNLTSLDSAYRIQVTTAGKYKIDWSMVVETAAAAQYIEGSVCVNATANVQAVNATETATASKQYSIGGTAILSLAANDYVSLCVDNETSTQDVIITHANLSLVMVGG